MEKVVVAKMYQGNGAWNKFYVNISEKGIETYCPETRTFRAGAFCALMHEILCVYAAEFGITKDIITKYRVDVMGETKIIRAVDMTDVPEWAVDYAWLRQLAVISDGNIAAVMDRYS